MSTPEDERKTAFDINAEARAHGEYLSLPQGVDEPDGDYRERIAGVLRGKGQIIEAHEVISGRRYDDPEQGDMGQMTGIIGAIAQEVQGRRFSPNDHVRQAGDDIAYGIIVKAGEDKGRQAIAAIFGVLGPEAGMDMIDAFREKPHPRD